jgi:organic hydroperoxide reductase OsmC/OhrA
MTSFKNALSCVMGRPAVTTMSGAKNVEIGPPIEYGGSADTLNPEELFVASINSCLMLVFYHFAEKSAVEIERYDSQAEGAVEKTRTGLRFTNVSVQVQVKVQGTDATSKLGELAGLAEKFCLVSNSVSCPVSYNVTAV